MNDVNESLKNSGKQEKINLPKELKRLNMVPYFGFAVISNLLVAGLIGYYIDKYTFNNKVIFIIFLCLGLFSGIYNGIKEMLKEMKIQDKIEAERRKEMEEKDK